MAVSKSSASGGLQLTEQEAQLVWHLLNETTFKGVMSELVAGLRAKVKPLVPETANEA